MRLINPFLHKNSKWFRSEAFVAFLVILIIGLILTLTSLGINAQIILLLAAIGLPVLVLFLFKPDYGFLILFFYTNFHFFIQRSFGIMFPLGTMVDLGLIIILGRILISTSPKISSITGNAILLYVFLWFVLIVFQVANPEGSSFSNWFYGFKAVIRLFILIAILYYFSKDQTFNILFIKFWFVSAIIVSLYGLYMDLIDIPGFELRIALADEKFRSLQFVGGRWRKWSFLQNSTDYGIYMATSGVFFLIYSFRKMQGMSRFFTITGAFIMIFSTAASGARTAFAIIGVGLLFFSFFYLHNLKMLIGFMILFMVFVTIIFGPIDHPSIRRIQSTFYPTDDLSYLVRENNKKKLKPYIYTHPHGGGLNTSGTDEASHKGNHPLNSIPSDSYYVRLILETGWFGMLIIVLLLGSILIRGINYYNNLKDSNSQVFILALITIMLMFSVAGYTQDNMYQLPYIFVFCYIIGVMSRLRHINKKSL